MQMNVTCTITSRQLLEAILDEGPIRIAALFARAYLALEHMGEDKPRILAELGSICKSDPAAQRFIDELHATIHVRPLP